MSIRRINLTELLINNIRIIPSRLIIDYRYINSSIDESKLAKISVLVSVVDGNPINICNMMDMFKPTESEYGICKFTTGIISLPTDKVATGIYIDIYNAEYVSINRISISQLQSGTQPNGLAYIEPIPPEVGYNVSPFVLMQISSTDKFMVNPLVFVETDVYNVNPFVLTSTTSYDVTPLVFTEVTTVYNVNPLVMVEITSAYNINPLALVEYETLGVNPLLFYGDTQGIFYLAHELTTAPVMPEGCIFYFSTEI